MWTSQRISISWTMRIATFLMAALVSTDAFIVPDNREMLITDFLNKQVNFLGNSPQSKAPLYISVGPPTSGKTTWLRNLRDQAPNQASALVDVSLDDQPNVYVPIPTALFCLTPMEMERPDLPQEYQNLLRSSLYQKTVQERILSGEHQEHRLVFQRLSGKLSNSSSSLI